MTWETARDAYFDTSGDLLIARPRRGARGLAGRPHGIKAPARTAALPRLLRGTRILGPGSGRCEHLRDRPRSDTRVRPGTGPRGPAAADLPWDCDDPFTQPLRSVALHRGRGGERPPAPCGTWRRASPCGTSGQTREGVASARTAGGSAWATTTSSCSSRSRPGEWFDASPGTTATVWRGPVVFCGDGSIVALSHSRYRTLLVDPPSGRVPRVARAPRTTWQSVSTRSTRPARCSSSSLRHASSWRGT